MAVHHTSVLNSSYTTIFCLVEKIVFSPEEFINLTRSRGLEYLDVRESMASLNYRSKRIEIVENDGKIVVAVEKNSWVETYVVPPILLDVHGTRFTSYAQYSSFFDAFPSAETFKVGFLTSVSLPRLANVADFTSRMAIDPAEPAHLLARIHELGEQLDIIRLAHKPFP